MFCWFCYDFLNDVHMWSVIYIHCTWFNIIHLSWQHSRSSPHPDSDKDVLVTEDILVTLASWGYVDIEEKFIFLASFLHKLNWHINDECSCGREPVFIISRGPYHSLFIFHALFLRFIFSTNLTPARSAWICQILSIRVKQKISRGSGRDSRPVTCWLPSDRFFG